MRKSSWRFLKVHRNDRSDKFILHQGYRQFEHSKNFRLKLLSVNQMPSVSLSKFRNFYFAIKSFEISTKVDHIDRSSFCLRKLGGLFEFQFSDESGRSSKTLTFVPLSNCKILINFISQSNFELFNQSL